MASCQGPIVAGFYWYTNMEDSFTAFFLSSRNALPATWLLFVGRSVAWRQKKRLRIWLTNMATISLFSTSIWPLWRHVKTIYMYCVAADCLAEAYNHWSVNFITCIFSTQEEDDHGSRRRLTAEMIFIELVSQRIQKVFVLTNIFRITIRFWETAHLPLP